jgi:Uma2 family endonuclease
LLAPTGETTTTTSSGTTFAQRLEEKRWGFLSIGLWTKRFTGNPKQQTITICELVDGDYQMTVFRGNNFMASPLFPQLNLTAQQIFDSAL